VGISVRQQLSGNGLLRSASPLRHITVSFKHNPQPIPQKGFDQLSLDLIRSAAAFLDLVNRKFADARGTAHVTDAQLAKQPKPFVKAMHTRFLLKRGKTRCVIFDRKKTQQRRVEKGED
jgi:hypothetical protein